MKKRGVEKTKKSGGLLFVCLFLINFGGFFWWEICRGEGIYGEPRRLAELGFMMGNFQRINKERCCKIIVHSSGDTT